MTARQPVVRRRGAGAAVAVAAMETARPAPAGGALARAGLTAVAAVWLATAPPALAAERWEALAALPRVAVDVVTSPAHPELTAEAVRARLEQRLRRAHPAPALDQGSAERLRLTIAVRHLSSDDLRGYHLPFSQVYGIGPVRLVLERPASLAALPGPVAALVWQSERMATGPMSRSAEEILGLVDEVVGAFLEDYRRALGQ